MESNGIITSILPTPEFPAFVPAVAAMFGAFGAYWFFGVKRRSL